MYIFFMSFLSTARERTKERRIRENLRFFLMNPFPFMMRARGKAALIALHTYLYPLCRVVVRR